MASAAQSLGDDGGEFEADDQQHICSLKSPGGHRTVKNTGTKPAIVGFESQDLVLAQPAAKAARYLAAGAEENIPTNCCAFTFLAAAAANNTYLRVSARV